MTTTASSTLVLRRAARDAQGALTSFIFIRAAEQPDAPASDVGSYADPSPDGSAQWAGWSDGVPEGELKLWMSFRLLTSDGLAPQMAAWKEPRPMTDTSSLDKCFHPATSDDLAPDAPENTDGTDQGSDPLTWHEEALPADEWLAMRTKSNGVWGAWSVVRTKGETGRASFKSFVFLRTAEAYPDAPTGGSYASPVPAGWSDGIPLEDGNPCWMSSRTFTDDGLGIQDEAWSTPQKVADTADVDFCFHPATSDGLQPEDPPAYTGTEQGSDTSTWHDTACEGDEWMAVRRQSNGQWGAWQVTRIKGEDGDTILSSKVEYAAGESGTDAPEEGEWQASVPSVPQGWYLWTRTTVTYTSGHEVQSYGVSRMGSDGETPLTCDIDNEMQSVALTAAGLAEAAATLTATLRAWYGAGEVTAECAAAPVTDGLPEGVTATCGEATEQGGIPLTVTVEAGAELPALTDVPVIVTHPSYGSRTLTLSLCGIRAGADGKPAVLYDLLPSSSAVRADAAGEQTFSLTCGYLRTEGAEATTVEEYTGRIDGKYRLYFRRRKREGLEWDGYWWLYTSYKSKLKGLTAVYDSVEFALSEDSGGELTELTGVIDRETVPVVTDGADGLDGLTAQPNLLDGTGFERGLSAWTTYASGSIIKGKANGVLNQYYVSAANSSADSYLDFLEQNLLCEARSLKASTWYTLSFYLLVSSGEESLTTYIYSKEQPTVSAIDSSVKWLVDGEEAAPVTDGSVTWPSVNAWTRHTLTFKTAATLPTDVWLLFRLPKGESAARVYVSCPKLEEGEEATPWQLSEADRIGQAGESAMVVQLDNEMDGVLVGQDGVAAGTQTFSVPVTVYYGTKDITADCTIVVGNSQEIDTSLVASPSVSGGVLTVTTSTGAWEKGATLRVQVTASHEEYGSRTATFTLAPAFPGEDGKPATTYNLLPSATTLAFRRTAAGGLSPSSQTLTCQVQKNEGGTLTNGAASAFGDFYIYYGTNSATSPSSSFPTAGLSVGSSSTARDVVLELWEGVRTASTSVMHDRQTISIVKDGYNGAAGNGIKSDVIYRRLTDTAEPPATDDLTATDTEWVEYGADGCPQQPTAALPYLWECEDIHYTTDTSLDKQILRLLSVYGLTAQPNLLRQTDFDGEMDAWSAANGTVVAGARGQYNAYGGVPSSSTYVNLLQQRVHSATDSSPRLLPSTRYTLSFWARTRKYVNLTTNKFGNTEQKVYLHKGTYRLRINAACSKAARSSSLTDANKAYGFAAIYDATYKGGDTTNGKSYNTKAVTSTDPTDAETAQFTVTSAGWWYINFYVSTNNTSSPTITDTSDTRTVTFNWWRLLCDSYTDSSGTAQEDGSRMTVFLHPTACAPAQTCFVDGEVRTVSASSWDGAVTFPLDDDTAPEAGGWTRHSVTWLTRAGLPTTDQYVLFRLFNTPLEIAQPKLEQGAAATDWQAAAEDEPQGRADHNSRGTWSKGNTYYYYGSVRDVVQARMSLTDENPTYGWFRMKKKTDKNGYQSDTEPLEDTAHWEQASRLSFVVTEAMFAEEVHTDLLEVERIRNKDGSFQVDADGNVTASGVQISGMVVREEVVLTNANLNYYTETVAIDGTNYYRLLTERMSGWLSVQLSLSTTILFPQYKRSKRLLMVTQNASKFALIKKMRRFVGSRMLVYNENSTAQIKLDNLLDTDGNAVSITLPAGGFANLECRATCDGTYEIIAWHVDASSADGTGTTLTDDQRQASADIEWHLPSKGELAS